jgi:ElaB/YqjD/DUF883 family membrane-anchored ribosome-binding protein
MPDDNAARAEKEISATVENVKKAAKAAADAAAEQGQKKLTETLETAERLIRDAAQRVEKAVREGVETIKKEADPYRDMAEEHFDDASKYVIERVKERPITATLAGLGVGLLLGLLLANRGSK